MSSSAKRTPAVRPCLSVTLTHTEIALYSSMQLVMMSPRESCSVVRAWCVVRGVQRALLHLACGV
jgi:hypothetical protein